jgi:hypothetical protein
MVHLQIIKGFFIVRLCLSRSSGQGRLVLPCTVCQRCKAAYYIAAYHIVEYCIVTDRVVAYRIAAYCTVGVS